VLRFLRRPPKSPDLDEESRSHVRVRPASGEPVAVHIVGRESLDILRARDISESGLGVYVPHRFEGCDIDSEVALVITLPGQRTFMARGQVKHHAEGTTSNFFGVQFTRISAPHRAKIRAYVKHRCAESAELRRRKRPGPS
jgi:c-di-GMP-binding flagellar brake protein YcgR